MKFIAAQQNAVRGGCKTMSESRSEISRTMTETSTTVQLEPELSASRLNRSCLGLVIRYAINPLPEKNVFNKEKKTALVV